MFTELAGWAELAELVANHVLTDIDRDVYAAVVDCDRATNHLWCDGAGARPGFYNCPIIGSKRCDFLRKLGIDEWAFFETSTHINLASSSPHVGFLLSSYLYSYVGEYGSQESTDPMAYAAVYQYRDDHRHHHHAGDRLRS